MSKETLKLIAGITIAVLGGQMAIEAMKKRQKG